MSRLALYLLGPPRIELDGTPVHIGRTKAIALLAYLAVTGRPHRRDTLATLLWPTFDQSGARAELRRALSTLNRTPGKVWLRTDHATIGPNPDAQMWLDINEFRQLLAACERHNHPSDEACRDCQTRLAEVVALYRDDFIVGFTLSDAPDFDEWQRYQTQNLRDKLGSALERLAGCLGAQREHDAAIAHVRRWLELDPIHEPAHRALMELYAQAGRRGAALRQYRRCVRVLEAELGAAPSPETTSLYEDLRAERPPPTEARFVSPPSLCVDALLPAFLAQEGAPVTVEAPVFVGRERELTQLERYLEASLDGRGQVVFITGGPGRGKTALMGEFTRRAMETHPDVLVAGGSCNAYSGVGDPFLPFRETMETLTADVETRWAAGGIATEHARRLWAALPTTARVLLDRGPHLIDAFVLGPALLRRATAVATGRPDWLGRLEGWIARERGEHSGLQQSALFTQFVNVLLALGPEHPLLLTLDDLQWVDSGSVGMLFHLGQRLADVGARVLIVGAYRPEEVALGRDGERHPLAEPLAEFQRRFGDMWIDLTRADAAEGRRLVDALLDAEPNRLDEDFRRELAGQTGGHPLFTVELLRAMQERDDLVRDSSGCWVEGQALDWETLPARVEGVIKARVDPLGEELREVLSVASVEGEVFTAQVVARVLDIPERNLLRTLSRELGPGGRRLVQEAEEVVLEGRFLSRYEFAHALFQAYLYHGLSAGERRLLHGEVGAALEALYGDLAKEIATVLAHHYGRAAQRKKTIEYALIAGDQARLVGATEQALAYYQQVLALLGTAPTVRVANEEAVWQLEALRGLGQVNYWTGQLALAEENLRDAIALALELALSPRSLARLYFWLAEVLFHLGNLDERMRLGEKGLEILVNHADSTEAALMNDVIAITYLGLGNREKYFEHTYRTADILQRLPYSEELGYLYDHVGLALTRDKKVEEAKRWFQALEQLAQPYNDLRALMQAARGIAHLLAWMGDFDGSISRYQQAIELSAKPSDATVLSHVLEGIAAAFLWRGDLQSCEEYAMLHLEAAESAQNRWQIALAYWQIGAIHLCHGAAKKAEDAFRSAAEDIQGFHLSIRAEVPAALGRAYLAQGKRKDALRQFQEAVAITKPSSSPPPDSIWWRQIFANALAGLEEAYQDREAFRAFCRQFIEENPKVVDSVFASWYLEPTPPARYFGLPILDSESGEDDLENLESVLGNEKWVWVDPFDDCSFSLHDGLQIHAASGRDLWHINLSAPRLLRPAPRAQAFALQTLCQPVSEEKPAIGGILLWKDKENYLRLDRGVWGSSEVSLSGCLGNEDAIIGRGSLDLALRPTKGEPWDKLNRTSDGVFLRLEQVEGRVRALCSADGADWFSVGEVEFPFGDELQVGLHAIGMIDRTVYHGAYTDGTAIRFDSFTLWGLED
jgi:DNA-binding SARP family transcriptional activator/predicted ATPase